MPFIASTSTAFCLWILKCWFLLPKTQHTVKSQTLSEEEGKKVKGETYKLSCREKSLLQFG